MLRESKVLTDEKEISARDDAARLHALRRSDDYAALLRSIRSQPEAVKPGQVLSMLAANYLTRVGEMWRIYYRADMRSEGEHGGRMDVSSARECLRLLAEEDDRLTRTLVSFGIIIPKTLQLHAGSKTSDPLAILRALRREVGPDKPNGGRPPALPSPPPPETHK